MKSTYDMLAPRRRVLIWVVAATLITTAGGWAATQLYVARRESNTRHLLTLARESASEGEWRGAVRLYRQYLARKTDDATAVEGFARALRENLPTDQSLIGDVVRTHERLILLAPEHEEAFEYLSFLYLRLGEFGLADSLTTKWQAINPDSSPAALARARALKGLGRPEECVSLLERAVRRDAGYLPAYELLVTTLVDDLGDPEGAAHWLRNALDIGPNDQNMRIVATRFYQKQGDVATAERHIERAKVIAPHDVNVFLAAAVFYDSQKRRSDQHQALERATAIAPHDTAVLNARARFALRQGEPTEQRRIARSLLEVAHSSAGGADDPYRIAQAAELFFRAADIADARQCIDMIESLSVRQNRSVVTSVATLRGAIALHENLPRMAISLLQRALETEQPNLWALQLMAEALATCGDYQSASRVLDRLQARLPDQWNPISIRAELAWHADNCDLVRAMATALEAKSEADQLVGRLMRYACDARTSSPTRPGAASLLAEARLEDDLGNGSAVDPTQARWLARCLFLTGQHQEARKLADRLLQQDDGADVSVAVELAQSLLSRGDIAEAGEVADAVLSVDPDSLAAHLVKLDGWIHERDYERAAQFVDTSTSSALIRARMAERFADALLAERDVDGAIGWLRTASTLAPAAISVLEKLSHSSPDREDAMDACRRMEALEGPHGLLSKFAEACVMLRFSPTIAPRRDAISLLEHCVRRRPDWALAHFHLALAYGLDKRVHNAADTFRIAFSFDQTLRRSPAATSAVRTFYRLGKYREGDRVLDELATALSGNETILRLMSARFIRTHDFPTAVQVARQLVALRGDEASSWRLLADVLAMAGQTDEAEATLREAYGRHPKDFGVLRALVRTMVRLHRAGEAETLTRAALQTESGARRHVLLAELLAERADRSGAEASVNRAMQGGSLDAQTLAAASEVYRLLQMPDRQIDLLRRAVEVHGEKPDQSFILARAMIATGIAEYREQATHISRSMFAADINDPQARFLACELALGEDPPNLDEAHTQISAVLRVQPDDPSVHHLLCAVEQLQGRREDARTTVLAGLAIAPNDLVLLSDSAKIHAALEQYSRVTSDLLRVLELQPENRDAIRFLAENYARMGQTREAITFLNSRVTSKQRSHKDLITLALLHEADGNLAIAEQQLRDAVKIDVASGEAQGKLLQFLARQARFADVATLARARTDSLPNDDDSLLRAAELLAAQRHDPELQQLGTDWIDQIAGRDQDRAAELTYRSAHCCMQRGDFSEAESRFLQALRHDPTDSRIVNDLAWLYTVELDRGGDAVALIERFMRSGSTRHAYLLDTYGLSLLHVGRLEAARHNLAHCLREAGHSRTRTAATYHLGLVYLQEGRARQALELVRQSVELDTRFPGLTDRERQQARELIRSQGS